jgi:hypothetical protein
MAKKKGWWEQLQNDEYPETQTSYGTLEALQGFSSAQKVKELEKQRKASIMNKLKKLREKEKEFKGFKPEDYSPFARMDVTKFGAFRDARKLLKDGEPSVGIYWIPDKVGKGEHYTYKVTREFEKDWKKKGWVKIAEIT